MCTLFWRIPARQWRLGYLSLCPRKKAIFVVFSLKLFIVWCSSKTLLFCWRYLHHIYLFTGLFHKATGVKLEKVIAVYDSENTRLSQFFVQLWFFREKITFWKIENNAYLCLDVMQKHVSLQEIIKVQKLNIFFWCNLDCEKHLSFQKNESTIFLKKYY